MCGIYGVLGNTRQPHQGLAAIRRRGPDGQGHWNDEAAHVWLGHVRLSIIDTSSAGHQPMHSHDGRVVMIYNGEIYNFRELRAGLEAQGERFIGHSDSEVLLALFARKGAACFRELNGIFAAAFYERDSGTVTVVRDPLGVKPLYYAQTPNGLVFASEMKALLRSGDVDVELDAGAVLHHLGFLWSPGEGTVVRGIRKLLPGHVMTAKVGSPATVQRYRDIVPAARDTPEISEADAARTVAEAVERAVCRQMVSDVPLGAFLSGGLDSSSVVAFARRHVSEGQRLQCFSIDIRDGATSEEGFADDLPFARRVAKHLDVDLHVVTVDGSMADRLAEMLYYLDEPTPDPAALNALFICELARLHGMKVLLSGAGGDDIFTGYRRHFALTQEGWWSWLPRPARAMLSKGTATLAGVSPLGRRVAKAFQYADLDADQRLATYFLWLPPHRALGLLSPRLRNQVDGTSMLAPMLHTLAEVPAGQVDPISRMLYLECKHFLADHNLNYTDKMGMAAGVEVRVPLLDLDLIDVAGRLPSHLKQRGRIGKWIFKRAMEPYLPHDVIYRPKTGFGVPLRRWLHGPLRGLVEDALSRERVLARDIFDPDAVQRLLQDDRIGRIDAVYPIFSMVCLELWCRQFIDRQYAVDA